MSYNNKKNKKIMTIKSRVAALTVVVLVLASFVFVPKPFKAEASNISFRAISSSSSDVISKPSGTAQDDLMVMFMLTANLGATAPSSISPPSGWTAIGSSQTRTFLGGYYSVRWQMAYKVAGGSEPSSYTFTGNGSYTDYGSIATYDNVDTSDPFDKATYGTFTSDSTPTASAITTTSDNELILTTFFGIGDGGTGLTWTPPSGMTERHDSSGTEIADVIKTTAGSSGTKTPTSNVTGSGSWFIGAFNSEVSITTLGNGTDGGNSTIAPGASATEIDRFSLSTNSGTDTVTGLTVTLGPTNAYTNIATVGVYTTGDSLKCSATPSSNTVPLTSCGIGVTNSSTDYVVKITPKTHANMPAVPGASYVTTATVTSITATNSTAGSDSGSASITVDNASPAAVTSSTATAGDTLVNLAWTNPADSDFTTGGTVVVLRRATSAVADVPVEGSSYSVGNTIGTATVACVVTGSPPSTSCSDTSLSNGTAYHYKIFTKDSRGNYNAGTVPTGSPATPFALSTTLGNGTDGGNSTIAPGAGATEIDRFSLVTNSGTDTVTGLTVTLGPTNAYTNIATVGVYTTGDVLKCSATPSSNTVALTSCGLSVTTSSTDYVVKITPKSHASMAAPATGASYSTTATVTSITATNTTAGTDSGSATITVDNLSPANVTSATAFIGDSQASFTWTNPVDTDLSKIMVLASTSAITFTPTEGTTYSTSTLSGASRVACYGLQTFCDDTSLTNGTPYYYKIFALDSNGNWSNAGVTPTGSPVTPVSGSETVIDNSVLDATDEPSPSPNTVFITDQIGYVFFVDSTSQSLSYRKTTNGGSSWGTLVVVDTAKTGWTNVAVWYDRWTPGDTTGTKIHIAAVDDGTDDVYYTYLDTNGDILKGSVVSAVLGSTFMETTDGPPSITKGAGGALFISGNFSVTAGGKVSKSTDGAGNTWSDVTPSGWSSNKEDQIQLLPLSTDNDIIAIRSGGATFTDLAYRVYDEVGNSWDGSWTSIATLYPNSTYRQAFSASLKKSTGNIYLSFANRTTNAANDIEFWSFSDSGRTWTQKTNLITDNATVMMPATLVDEGSGNLHVAYLRGTLGDQMQVYYKYSTDGGTTWSEESTSLNPVTKDDFKALRGNLLSGDRLYVTWFNDDLNDLLGNTIPFTETVADLTVTHYRWRNDDGSQSTATYLDAEDNAVTTSANINKGDRKRLRFLVSNTGGSSASNLQLQLEHSSSSCSVWMPVPDTVSNGTHWSMDISSKVTNGAPTTNSSGLTDPGGESFVSGFVMTSSNTTPSITLSSTEFTEVEFSIKSTTDAETGLQYCFRLVRNGSSSEFTYSNEPKITLSSFNRQGGGPEFGSSSGGVLVTGGEASGGDSLEGSPTAVGTIHTRDRFTEGSNTTLASHSPDIGSSWVAPIPSNAIVVGGGGYVQENNNPDGYDYYIASKNMGQDLGIYVEADFTKVGSTAHVFFGLALRSPDTLNPGQLEWAWSTGNNGDDAGQNLMAVPDEPVTETTASWALGATRKVRLEIGYDGSVSVFIDGSLIDSRTAGTFTAGSNNYAGILLSNLQGSASSNINVDNFEAGTLESDVVSGGGSGGGGGLE